MKFSAVLKFRGMGCEVLAVLRLLLSTPSKYAAKSECDSVLLGEGWESVPADCVRESTLRESLRCRDDEFPAPESLCPCEKSPL